jgi:hypothetical protein
VPTDRVINEGCVAVARTLTEIGSVTSAAPVARPRRVAVTAELIAADVALSVTVALVAPAAIVTGVTLTPLASPSAVRAMAPENPPVRVADTVSDAVVPGTIDTAEVLAVSEKPAVPPGVVEPVVTVTVSVAPLYASYPTSKMYQSALAGLATSQDSSFASFDDSQSTLPVTGGTPRLTKRSTSPCPPDVVTRNLVAPVGTLTRYSRWLPCTPLMPARGTLLLMTVPIALLGGTVTVMVADARRDGSAAEIAVIIACPTPRPWIIPLDVTVATASALEVQLTAVFGVPVTVADSTRVSPTDSDADALERDTATV